jgi:hypothetical protein
VGKTIVLKSHPPLPPWALPEKVGGTTVPTTDVSTDEILDQSDVQPEIATISQNNTDPNPIPEPKPKNGRPIQQNPNRRCSWNAEIVEAILQASLAKSPQEAVQALNASQLEVTITPEQAIAYFQAI